MKIFSNLWCVEYGYVWVTSRWKCLVHCRWLRKEHRKWLYHYVHIQILYFGKLPSPEAPIKQWPSGAILIYVTISLAIDYWATDGHRTHGRKEHPSQSDFLCFVSTEFCSHKLHHHLRDSHHTSNGRSNECRRHTERNKNEKTQGLNKNRE